MALANKKQSNILEKTDTNSKFYTSNSTITEMSASFAQADHIQASHYFEENKALIYQLNQMQEEIDELRRYVTNEATGSAISELSGSIKVTLPTRSVGLSSGEIYVLTEKDGTKTIKSA
jgi:uncharacterized membrane protein YgaE (UPF0421/DUF939 family)